MPEFSITSPDFNEGEEIPKKCGYKHGNERPQLKFHNSKEIDAKSVAVVMDDPDAMAAVGKVWVHYLRYITDISSWMTTPTGKWDYEENEFDVQGLNDFGEIGYGGPAPPDKRHTYVFKAYALDTTLDLKEGYSKQELEDAMKGHIIAEAKLTGTYAP
jgi:Raf kinase inhibitor-like YbhB/YbcL family protein